MAVISWLLLIAGAAFIAGPLVILAAGARVERIVWADTGILGMFAATWVTIMSLVTLGWLTGDSQTAKLGFYLGFGFVAVALLGLLPVALMVARVRKRKGWLLSIAGKAPVAK